MQFAVNLAQPPSRRLCNVEIRAIRGAGEAQGRVRRRILRNKKRNQKP
jgi:hypothetical protein